MIVLAVAVVQAILVIALVANLTRRRRAERSLREREARLRLLSNAAPVMLWIAGRDKLCTDFNRPWLEFTGRPIEAELGNGWTEAVHPDDLARCLETYHRAFERRESFRMEYRLRRHDGEYRWFLDAAVPRFLDDGAFAGYVGSAVDITDLRLASDALSNLSQRLMQTHEKERALVARELQEDLCQRMMALTMRLHGLSQAAESRDLEMRHRVEELSGQFADVASAIFTISDQLHSSKLDLLGLAAATRIYCNEVSGLHDVTFQVCPAHRPEDVPKDVALALFRVMQEAVQNALQHSSARRVAVSLLGSPDEIQLEVVDDGVGFDLQAVMKDHAVGLIAMRERLRLVAGQFAVESHPGGGTRISARAPSLSAHARSN
jgi:PAS domain S-box-containing protein